MDDLTQFKDYNITIVMVNFDLSGINHQIIYNEQIEIIKTKFYMNAQRIIYIKRLLLTRL